MNHEDERIEQIKKTLDDTLYVFAAEDGGVAYAKLIHGIMPTIYSRMKESDGTFYAVLSMFDKWGGLMKLAKGDYDESHTSAG